MKTRIFDVDIKYIFIRSNIYEGADALRCFCGCSQAAGLENDDDMWGINPLTRIYGTRAQYSICVSKDDKV